MFGVRGHDDIKSAGQAFLSGRALDHHALQDVKLFVVTSQHGAQSGL